VSSSQRVFDQSEPPLRRGSCVLGRPEAAKLVQTSLLYFEGRRYYLSSWSVMSNHVHVVVTPLADYTLSAILHSWKSYTSTEINKLLNRNGELWERESFDHLIRSENDWQKFVEYTEYNPVEAGLCGDPADWPYSSCGVGFQPAEELHFIDPRKTPYAPVQERGELPHLFKECGTYFVTFCLADAGVRHQ